MSDETIEPLLSAAELDEYNELRDAQREIAEEHAARKDSAASLKRIALAIESLDDTLEAMLQRIK